MYLLEVLKELIKNAFHDLWVWVCFYIETIIGISITVGTFTQVEELNLLNIPITLVGVNWATLINQFFSSIMSIISGVVSAYLINKYITKRKKK